MAAHQAPPSLGLSRQEHWSGLPFPSPMRESEVIQSCPTLCNPMDCSLPGSSIHGIFQARVLEWVASAFSDTFMWQNIWNMGFLAGAVVKNMPANAGDGKDMDSIPGSGRSLGVRNGNLLQHSPLENTMGMGAWWVIVHGVLETQAQLSD